MTEQSITYFPVGNGDTGLIYLSDDTTIIIDCHILEDGVYDVKGHLLEILKYANEIPHTDVFVLTHPHDDHIHGFQDTFYTGDSSKYSGENKENGLIIIDEVWFAPRIFNEDDEKITEDATVFKEEAERRIKLYKNKDNSRLLQGNRLRLIGATGNLDCSGLDDIRTLPGEALNLINNDEKDDFRFFIYAPVKRDSDSDNNDINNTSIVMQARFDIDGEEEAVRAFFGGDAESPVWQRIVNRNDDENLTWDLFLAPHHCSWTFFNDTGDEPLDEPLHLLEQKREGAFIIASSKPIKNNDDNPPSYKAKKEYLKFVGEDCFKCTGEEPNEDEPQPIHFVMSQNGPSIGSITKSKHKTIFGVISSATSQPRTYG